ncbi:MAG: FxsA family protein [Kiritimatiellae bacterium]|nr:FxsA family protein [Kiritimatiellia bacterium]
MVFGRLALLFILMPLFELVLLLKVNTFIGWERTLAIVIVTGLLGAAAAKTQGLLVLSRIRQDLAEGRVPASQLLDGVMILLAGALLITPGLITDTFGFLLLLPFVRTGLKAWLRRKLEQKIRDGSGSMRITYWRQGPPET